MATLNKLMALVFSIMTFAQVQAFDLKVHGVVTEYLSGTVITNALVRIYKDGVKQQAEETGILGVYAVKLDNNARYVIRFSAPGHQTKCFSVDTHGLAWEGDNKTKDLFVEMTLFERISDMDLSYFDLPMGMARFQPATGLVTWDEQYDSRIRAEVQAIMGEYERRMTATADASASTGSDEAMRSKHSLSAR
jgi:hypothetical protein